jgi:hypothetical protein
VTRRRALTLSRASASTTRAATIREQSVPCALLHLREVAGREQTFPVPWEENAEVLRGHDAGDRLATNAEGGRPAKYSGA